MLSAPNEQNTVFGIATKTFLWIILFVNNFEVKKTEENKHQNKTYMEKLEAN